MQGEPIRSGFLKALFIPYSLIKFNAITAIANASNSIINLSTIAFTSFLRRFLH